MLKPRREKAGSLSKYEDQKPERWYNQGGAAFGCARNLSRASNLSVSKLRQLLHSEPSITNITLATQKFKRMKTFAWVKNEIWCMDLKYVDKSAKDINGVKYLLVRQDLFDRTVDAKRMKTKEVQKNGSCIFDFDYEKIVLTKFFFEK